MPWNYQCVWRYITRPKNKTLRNTESMAHYTVTNWYVGIEQMLKLKKFPK